MTLLNQTLGFTIVGALLLSACGLGNYAAYIAMMAALAIAALPSNWQQLSLPFYNISVRCFLLGYAALAIPVVLQALSGGTPETVFDFLPLGLSIPAALGFLALSNRMWPHRLFALALAGSLIAFAVVAYGHFVLQNPRPRGAENSPIHYAILAATLGFLAAGGFLTRPGWKTTPYLIGPFLGIAAALMTGTRAALPTVVLLALVAFCATLSVMRIRTGQVLIGALVILLLTLAVIAGFSAMDTGADRAILGLAQAFRAIQGDFSADTSMAYRLEQYRAFIPAFFDSPWIGHGWHRQLQAAFPYLTEFGQRGYEAEGWGYIHNEALSLALGMGIFGLIGYAAIFAAPFLGVSKAERDTAFPARVYGVSTVSMGIFAGGLTDVLFMAELPKTFLVMVTLAFLLTGQQRDLQAHHERNQRSQ